MPYSNASTQTKYTPKYDCSICLERKCIECKPPLYIGIRKKIIICSDCIEEYLVPMFEEAVKYEHAFPVKFGALVLTPFDFKGRIPDGLAQRYRRRMLEYSIPVVRRAYCKNLIEEAAAPEPRTVNQGRKLALPLTQHQAKYYREKANVKIIECGAILAPELMGQGHTCYRCKGEACWTCGEPCKDLRHHKCQRTEEDVLEALTCAPDGEGLVRGKHFQLCPKCHTPYELKDGCNWMRCTQTDCKEGFCFICGKGGLRDTDQHWRAGMPCSRYNQPGAHNAVHDGFVDGRLVVGDVMPQPIVRWNAERLRDVQRNLHENIVAERVARGLPVHAVHGNFENGEQGRRLVLEREREMRAAELAVDRAASIPPALQDNEQGQEAFLRARDEEIAAAARAEFQQVLVAQDVVHAPPQMPYRQLRALRAEMFNARQDELNDRNIAIGVRAPPPELPPLVLPPPLWWNEEDRRAVLRAADEDIVAGRADFRLFLDAEPAELPDANVVANAGERLREPGDAIAAMEFALAAQWIDDQEHGPMD